MKQGLTPAVIVIATMWFVIVGALFQKVLPRTAKAVQGSIIFVGLVLLLSYLLNRFYHRG